MRLLLKCHRCDRWITDGEPYTVDEYGYAHLIDCSPDWTAS